MTEETVNRIFEKLDKQGDTISLLKETIGIMANQLTDLHHCVKGNGKPGLIQEFNEHKDSDTKIRFMFAGGLMLVAAGGATSGAMFFELLKKLILGI